MTCFVGLDVSQKMTAICVVDNAGRRLWWSQCPTIPEQISMACCAGFSVTMALYTRVILASNECHAARLNVERPSVEQQGKFAGRLVGARE
jgi:hypothetical protein